MFKREKGKHSLRLFMVALAMVVMVFVVLALPYAVTSAYGLKANKLMLPMRLVLAVFSAGLLIFWVVRYRQTSHDLEMLREKIRNRHGHKREQR